MRAPAKGSVCLALGIWRQQPSGLGANVFKNHRSGTNKILYAPLLRADCFESNQHARVVAGFFVVVLRVVVGALWRGGGGAGGGAVSHR